MGDATLLRGDALNLPLADESVDLIVTSPPYFALRSYRDDGGHYDGQIGSEDTPQAFLEALWAATAEMARVLKPSGSIFVNLGDKYVADNRGSGGDVKRGDAKHAPRGPAGYPTGGLPHKSLMLLPERYRIGCVDRLGLIARAVVIWDKPNGLPESAQDRVRRSHEDWVHLTKQAHYFSAVDEIREAHSDSTLSRTGKTEKNASGRAGTAYGRALHGEPETRWVRNPNPLGKLPGSVWTIATEPLRAPDYMAVRHPGDMAPVFLPAELAARQWAHLHGLEHDGHPANRWPRQEPAIVAAPDHFAAFPTEWPRRLILGWSPSGVCTVCGEGRRPVVESWRDESYGEGRAAKGGRDWHPNVANHRLERVYRKKALITGEVCACPTPDAPTQPAVVLDPFCGTGTVPMVARILDRHGVGVDLSADYLRLARWRVWQSGHAAKAEQRTWRDRQTDLFAAN